MSKYFAHKFTDPRGNKWDSKKEYYRWLMLDAMERDGKIRNLVRQVRFQILPQITHNVEKKLKTKTKLVERVLEKAKFYTADFVYEDDEHVYVEDVKSSYTKTIRDYPLRRHLMRKRIQEINEEYGRDYYVFIETES